MLRHGVCAQATATGGPRQNNFPSHVEATRMLRSAISAFTRVFDGTGVRGFRGTGYRATGAAPAQARDRLRQDPFLAFRTCRPLYMPVFKSR